MPVFPKPGFSFDYNLATERRAFDEFFAGRGIPAKRGSELDLATWNIANLGAQKRRPKDLALIAHILARFDVIAVQEVRAQLAHFREVMRRLGNRFRCVFTDVAGNEERLAVVYRPARVRPGPLVAELDYNPNGVVRNGTYIIEPKKQRLRLGGRSIETFFENFNRNPMLTTWEVVGSQRRFLIANVHIYYGSSNSAKFNNRIAEVYFLADWAKACQRRSNAAKVYEPNVVLIGDMNVPTMASDDRVYRALTRRGFVRTRYSSEAGTTIQEFTSYDQIVFANENLPLTPINGQSAVVVDFDNFVFRRLWQQVEAGERTLSQFKAWTKFAISDHRPVFVRMRV
ncbi:MAG TPA: endonuclease/exonuclease/phosphatase family protein [Gemmatimonadales bacterium]|jgi:exonuclease III